MERSRLKKRLVGATVLLSLTVILLPLVVDYQREPEQHFTPVAVPAAPAYRDYPSRVVPIEIPEEVADRIEQGVVSRQLAAAAALPDPDDAGKTAPVLDLADADSEEQTLPEADVEPKAESDAPPAVSNGLDKGWVVQVGTFKNLDSAKRLGSQLKKLGFVVYIEPLQLSTGVMSRVRIGPQLLREDAERQQLRLQETTDFNGAILSFP